MTHSTLTPASPATRSDGPPSSPARPSQARPAVPCRQLTKEEADRRFDAAVRWFLAVSRAA